MAKETQSKPGKREEVIEIRPLQKSVLDLCVLGTTPFVCNRMSEKGVHSILFPAAKKNAAERASTLKHHPFKEFLASPYMSQGTKSPTRVLMLATAFKGAMADAAKDIPGAAKAQIGRLTFVVGDYVPIYGIPQIYSTIVRQAGIQRAPDVRTRAIVPQWATTLSVEYVTPLLKEKDVINLMAGAGIIRGVGDGRPEKGKLAFGQFELVGPKDPRFVAILKSGGLKAQDQAFASPEPYDRETGELLSWWTTTLAERGFDPDGNVVDPAKVKASAIADDEEEVE